MMKMDFGVILWIGGMLFSLGIFAVKVGFGLSFVRVRGRGVFLTLYLLLFVGMAQLSGDLIGLLEPVLRKGPYLHIAMALGMIAWGIILLRKQKTEDREQTNSKYEIKNSKISNLSLITRHSLLLLVPCPVCLTAMTFSIWSALNAIRLPAALVGLSLGMAFIVLSLAFYIVSRRITRHGSRITEQTGLGLGMTALGLYFLSSLFLPAKIEEAKGIYSSFATEGSAMPFHDTAGVVTVLLAAALIGFFAKKHEKSSPSVKGGGLFVKGKNNKPEAE